MSFDYIISFLNEENSSEYSCISLRASAFLSKKKGLDRVFKTPHGQVYSDCLRTFIESDRYDTHPDLFNFIEFRSGLNYNHIIVEHDSYPDR